MPKHQPETRGLNQACCTLPVSSPKCAHRPAKTQKAPQRRCRAAAPFTDMSRHDGVGLSSCRTADPLGVCDVKDRVSRPPKLSTQVHDESVPAPDSRCRTDLLQESCQLSKLTTYSVWLLRLWETDFSNGPERRGQWTLFPTIGDLNWPEITVVWNHEIPACLWETIFPAMENLCVGSEFSQT